MKSIKVLEEEQKMFRFGILSRAGGFFCKILWRQKSENQSSLPSLYDTSIQSSLLYILSIPHSIQRFSDMAEEADGGFTIHFGDTDNWENVSVETLSLVYMNIETLLFIFLSIYQFFFYKQSISVLSALKFYVDVC